MIALPKLFVKFFPLFTFILLLSACSSEIYDRAYTAVGDGLEESELTEIDQFTPTDDFNVVVKLQRNDDSVEVRARFLDPNGDVFEEAVAQTTANTGTVILGVDYEAREDAGLNQWIAGRYTVELFINDEEVDRLFFRVD